MGDAEERKKGRILYLHLSWIFIYANRFCLFIPTSGKLHEDLYKLNLSATEQLWIFWLL
jgi:hypothetical protein